jgi:3-oxoacyl-[acyl-carrier protein] reductase
MKSEFQRKELSMARLANKVAIVTGASKGIGAGIAKALAAEGASVVVNYASSRAGADKVVAEIKNAGGKAVAVQGDVSKKEDVKKLFAETKAAFGKLDVLVNNAGVYEFASLAEVTLESYNRHYNINVLGPILATQEALKYFPDSGGSVINISSVVGTRPFAGATIYSSTKGALDNLSRGLALELAPKKIRVNVVSPGYTLTEGVDGIFDEAALKKISAETPLGRPGKPEDIAPTVVFLASDESAWLTGEVINASGGLR